MNSILNSRTVKIYIILAAMLATLVLVQGCALLVVGGVAAGAAYGTVEYINNTLTVTQMVSLERAWSAAYNALKELNMPVTSSKKDGESGTLTSRNAQGQNITIEETWQNDTTTEIKITVGTFDSTANRAAAQQIYEKMQTVIDSGARVH